MTESKIYFYKGNEEVLLKSKNQTDGATQSELIKKIQDSFNKVLDGKNLSFLLGSGCSSSYVDGKEIGIPTMAPLAKDFYKNFLQQDEKEWLKEKIRMNIDSKLFNENLEAFLGSLHSLIFFYESTSQTSLDEHKKVKKIIEKARNFLLEQCLNEKNREDDTDVELVNLYKTFYRKLLYRNANLPKPSIFTTNYDLYSEIALDSLGVEKINDF